MVWFTEFFDATVTRIDPSVMASSDCTALGRISNNPCIHETFVGIDGYDASSIHSLAITSDGSVWFDLADYMNHTGQIGVIDPDDYVGGAFSPAISDRAERSSAGLYDQANGESGWPTWSATRRALS